MRANTGISFLVLLMAVAGVGVSGYLTSVHYSGVPLVCSSDGIVNCHSVLTSSYAEVAGIPWSLGGIGWFGVSGALAAMALLRRPEPVWLQPAQAGWGFLGLLTVVYLVGLEVLAVDRICLWCTSMHALILLTFALNLVRRPEAGREEGWGVVAVAVQER